MPKITVRQLTVLAMLSALAYLVMFLTRALPPVIAIPPLKYDPKDVIIIIGGFLYGPLSVVLMSAVVSLIEMFTVSATGWIGFVMNVISTCAFGCTAAMIYRYRKTLGGAVIGLCAGVIAATAVMMLWNYVMTPIFLASPEKPVEIWRSEVASAMLLQVFLPFNLVKGGINAAVTFLAYKHAVRALRLSGLLPKPLEPDKFKFNLGTAAFAAFVLLTCILLVLVLQGKI
jgi:riboflavin transporter FmnP